MSKIIGCVNQKGGVGKTVTTVNLGIGLARQGYRVLLVDLDPQASLSICLGLAEPDELPVTISDVFHALIHNEPLPDRSTLFHSTESVDFIPSSIQLAGMELALGTVMSRERKLKRYLDTLSEEYDYIIIDCAPSLSMLTVNAMVASHSVIIPVQASYLSAKGMQQLFSSLISVREELNPELTVDGILFTMVDRRGNHYKQMMETVRSAYDENIRVFESVIPASVKTAESTAFGQSIFTFDKRGKVALAYDELVKEVLQGGK